MRQGSPLLTTVLKSIDVQNHQQYLHTPNENLSDVDRWAAFTAHKPTAKEIMSFNCRSSAQQALQVPCVLTIWKASAMRANELTHMPTPSSSRKNAKSITSIMMIRVDFDQAILSSQRLRAGPRVVYMRTWVGREHSCPNTMVMSHYDSCVVAEL